MCIAVALSLFAASPVTAQQVEVTIDTSAARAVLAAVQNPDLTEDRALEIARLPGNRGLIRKAISYGRTADEASFAAALLATVRGQPSADPSRFAFDVVRDHAAATVATLDALEDPSNGHMDAVKRRILTMTPKDARAELVGRIVVGGTSGGFSFGDPEFFLNIDRYPSAPLAATVMRHEMYHGIQGVVMKAAPLPKATEQCLEAGPAASLYGSVLAPLLTEGTASYVGDLLAQAEPLDPVARAERDKFQRNVDRVSRAVTLLELSSHALTTASGINPDDIYELGFYGDEILYALGYVMTRAIAAEQGDAAVATLLNRKVYEFVTRYTALASYGTSDDVPRLGPITVRWAARMARCGQ